MTTLATINNKGLYSMTVNNMTATRMATILNRTQDAIIAVGKAMMIENLKTKMANGVAHFVFAKKDGSIREAWGTIKEKISDIYVDSLVYVLDHAIEKVDNYQERVKREYSIQ